MNLSDLTGLSKPLTRLVEVVAKGTGNFFAPHLIKKNANARAYELDTMVNAIKDAGMESSLEVSHDGDKLTYTSNSNIVPLDSQENTILSRATQRANYQELKRQDNLEKVTEKAADALGGEKEIADESPDDDWINRFFSSAQEVSSDKMQTLWGRILAGEVKQPGSYSLRTLDFLRNLTASEAKAFEELGRYALNFLTLEGYAAIPTFDMEWLEKERNIQVSKHLFLGELGLMYPEDLSSVLQFDKKFVTEVHLWSREHIMVIERNQCKVQVELPVWKFTDVGRQLLPLIDRPLDMAYLVKVADFYVQKKARVTIGKVTRFLRDGKFNYKTLKVIDPTQQG